MNEWHESGPTPSGALANAAPADVLARLAADFSPRYERVDEDMVLIDVSGLGRVIGPPVEVARELVRAAAAYGVRLALAIASTRTAATLLALHGATLLAAQPAAAALSASGRVPAACTIEIHTIGGSAITSSERAHVAAAAAPEQATAPTQTIASAQTTASKQTTTSVQLTAPEQVAAPEKPTASKQTTVSVQPPAPMQTMGSGTGRGAPRLSRRRVAAPAPPVGIVVSPGEEARALAALPISLLARLPGDPHGVMTGLPGVPQGDRARGGGADDGGRGAAAGKGTAGRGRGGARFSEQANGAYGKTRGTRSRGSGRNYRLAPSPGETRAETIALLDTLQRWGLHTLGELLRLPAAELFERFGPASFWLRQVACGQDARPLVPTVAEEAFDAELALEWPIENLEPLAFVISRLLDPLCARLEQRDRGAVVVHVTLRLVTRCCETRRLELPAPMRDAKVLRTLILLDLESHPPGAGIDVVTLRFDVTPGRIVQHSLLTRALPSPEQLSTLIARLTAVMGEGRVGAPALIDSHRPEAFALRRFDPPAVASPLVGTFAGPLAERFAPAAGRGGAAGSSRGGAEGAASAADEARAQLAGPAMPAGSSLRRFRRPLPVDVRVEGDRPVHLAAARGVRGGRIVQAAGPWRSSGQWWQLESPGAPVPPTAPAATTTPASPTAPVSPTTSASTTAPVSPTAPVSATAPASPTTSASTRARASPTTLASMKAAVSATMPVSPTAHGGVASVPGAFTRAWERDEWDIVLAGGELCRIYYDVARRRWLLESIID